MIETIDPTESAAEIFEAQAPTGEQLRDGYFLKPNEVVTLPTDIRGEAKYTIRLGADKPLELRSAQNIGIIYVGDVAGGVRAEASLVLDNGGNKWIALRTQGGENGQARDTDVYTTLSKETPFVIGRGFPGQEDIGDTVSGEHCAVSLNDKGDVVVENYTPTNTTAVRSYVK